MNAAGPPPAGERGQGAADREGPHNIATAIAEVSERASQLVREEIELAKAEMTEKATKLVKGAIIGAAAGVFFVMALFFVLVGCAWLLYFYLPLGNNFTYFWGFFAMAVILVVLGVLAGLIAARAVKRGTPPVPNMAIEEARKIRETVGQAQDAPPPVVSMPPDSTVSAPTTAFVEAEPVSGAPTGPGAATAPAAAATAPGAVATPSPPAGPGAPGPFGEPATAAAAAAQASVEGAAAQASAERAGEAGDDGGGGEQD